MLAWLRNLRRRRPVNKSPRRTYRPHLGIEQLEDRRLMASSLSGQALPFLVHEGGGVADAVARFTDSSPGPGVTYTATIDWGDQSGPILAPVTPKGNSFDVGDGGTHKYAEEGGFLLDVFIVKKLNNNPTGDTLDVKEQVSVTDASLGGSNGTLPNQTEGTAFNGIVMHFTDQNAAATVNDFTTGTGGATIDWGDGNTTSGSVASNSGGGFDVSGTHTYTAHGNFQVSVQINDKGGSTITLTDMVQVSAPLLDPISTTATPANQVPGQVEGTNPNGLLTVATFTDTLGNTGHTAKINWGDGTKDNPDVTNGTVTDPAGVNPGTVTGSHTYAEEGTYQITVSVSDQNAANTDGDFTTIVVADAPLVAQNAVPINNKANPLPLDSRNAPLLTATFTDQGGAEPVKNYSATIDWGDGTPATAVGVTITLEQNGTTFDVTGGHLYAIPSYLGVDKNYRYTITTTIRNELGQPVMAVANPVVVGTQNQRFVEQAYLDLLARHADPGGLSYFSTRLDQKLLTRAQVASILMATDAYRALVVKQIYRDFLNREADAGGLDFFVAYLRNGGSREGVKALIAGSIGGSAEAFVDAVYLSPGGLGRLADANGRAYFAGLVNQGVSRTVVASLIITSAEGAEKIVNDFYMAYLRRLADHAPNELNGFAKALLGGWRDEMVIAILVGSDEYLQRIVG